MQRQSDNVKPKLIRRKGIFDGKYGFAEDTVAINGRELKFQYLDHPGSAGIVAVHDGKILLVKQYRYVVDDTNYEIPCGTLEKDETPEAAARRELEEEAGYKAEKFTKLGTVYPSSGNSNEICTIFFASRLKKGVQKLDDDEFIVTELVDIEKIGRLIRNGIIKDAIVISAIALAKEKGLL